MNNRLTPREREHLKRIKAMDCVVCGAAGPCDAHHVRQGEQWTCIPLCKACHQGALLGIHGQKRAWAIRKWDELDALNETTRRLMAGV